MEASLYAGGALRCLRFSGWSRRWLYWCGTGSARSTGRTSATRRAGPSPSRLPRYPMWLSRSQLTDCLRLSSRRSPARIAETNTSTALCGWCVETAAGELFPELRSTFFFGRAWGCQGALLQRAELRALQQRPPCLLCHPICASGDSLMLKTKFYISTDTLTTHSVLRQTNVLWCQKMRQDLPHLLSLLRASEVQY